MGVEAATIVYTDGACKGNPGPGGWAWVVLDGPSGSGGAEQTTNQRMELEAVLRAVSTLDGPLVIHSDSTYVVNCFRDRWYEGWIARGWRNSSKKPVANRDLWEPLIEAYRPRSDEIEFRWVKGHAGDPGNEAADALAVAAAEAAAGTAGAPTTVDETFEAPWASARAIAVLGGGGIDADGERALRRLVDGLDPGSDLLVSGLRRGAELVAAEQAIRRRVPLHVVLPFADPAARWPERDRRRFDAARAAATDEVVLGGDPTAPGAAVEARDRWILGRVAGLVDPDDGALGDLADQAGVSVIPLPAD